MKMSQPRKYIEHNNTGDIRRRKRRSRRIRNGDRYVDDGYKFFVHA
jgi:hypothetical protein